MEQCIENVETKGLGTDAGSRGNMYKFLANVFLDPPTEEILSLIGDPAFLADLSESFSDDVISDLKQFAESYSGQIDETVQEYHNLFKVPLGQYVTPYESVYRDKIQGRDGKAKGRLVGESTIAVESFYKYAGLGIDYATYRELADHIGVELAFMQHLCEEQDKAGRSGDSELANGYAKLQNKFLDRHLRKWVPGLAENIARKTQKHFYKGIAAILQEFVKNDSGSTPGKVNS